MSEVINESLSTVVEYGWFVSVLIVTLAILVAGDVLWRHYRTYRTDEHLFSRMRRALWISGATVALLLLILSFWAHNQSGYAATESVPPDVSGLSDWDDHVTKLTISTAPSETAKKKAPKEDLQESAKNLLPRSVTSFDSALVYMGLDRYDESVVLIDREIEKVENAGDQPHLIPRLLYFRSLANSFGGNDSVALADCDSALARDPLYAEAWMNRAFLLMKLGRFDEAPHSAHMASRYADQRSFPCILGAAFYQHGNWPAAIENLDAALAIDSLYPEARALRSIVAQLLEYRDRSSSDASASLALDSTSAIAWSQMAVLSALFGDTLSLRENLSRAYKYVKSDTCDVLVRGAIALITAKAYYEARDALNGAIEGCADNFWAWYYLAVVSSELGDYEVALTQIDGAISRDIGTGEALALKSIILHDSGVVIGQCLKYVDSAFDVGSQVNAALAWVIKGETLLELKQTDLAAAAFDSAFATSAGQPQLGYRIANGLFMTDRPDSVVREAMAMALTYDTNWSEVHSLDTLLTLHESPPPPSR